MFWWFEYLPNSKAWDVGMWPRRLRQPVGAVGGMHQLRLHEVGAARSGSSGATEGWSFWSKTATILGRGGCNQHKLARLTAAREIWVWLNDFRILKASKLHQIDWYWVGNWFQS